MYINKYIITDLREFFSFHCLVYFSLPLLSSVCFTDEASAELLVTSLLPLHFRALRNVFALRDLLAGILLHHLAPAYFAIFPLLSSGVPSPLSMRLSATSSFVMRVRLARL